jgi:hypothetical protein
MASPLGEIQSSTADFSVFVSSPLAPAAPLPICRSIINMNSCHAETDAQALQREGFPPQNRLLVAQGGLDTNLAVVQKRDVPAALCEARQPNSDYKNEYHLLSR